MTIQLALQVFIAGFLVLLASGFVSGIVVPIGQVALKRPTARASLMVEEWSERGLTRFPFIGWMIIALSIGPLVRAVSASNVFQIVVVVTMISVVGTLAGANAGAQWATRRRWSGVSVDEREAQLQADIAALSPEDRARFADYIAVVKTAPEIS